MAAPDGSIDIARHYSRFFCWRRYRAGSFANNVRYCVIDGQHEFILSANDGSDRAGISYTSLTALIAAARLFAADVGHALARADEVIGHGCHVMRIEARRGILLAAAMLREIIGVGR